MSVSGGVYPAWIAATHQLVFANPYDPSPAKIMAARYEVTGDSFRAETPKVWSPTSVEGVSLSNAAYALHPDGQRMAAAAVIDDGTAVHDRVVLFFNFADYLATIAPRKK